MTRLATKFLSSAAFLALVASPGFAQVPAHGTVPEITASNIFTPTSSYSTANPNATFEWNIMHNDSAGYAPFDTQHLEISTPNSPPVTIDMLTNSQCVQMAIRIFKCLVQYPMSTADMTGSSVSVTARYYATKNGGSYQGYHRDFGTVNGQAGSTGSVTGGGGSTIPPVTQIPPHTSITADTPYQITVSSSLPNYSTSNNIVPINLVISPNSPPSSISPAFANELVEIKSPTGTVKSLNIASECTRSAPNNMTLTCNTSYVLPAADAAQPNLIFEGRYFAQDYYATTQTLWTGYSSGSTLLQGTVTGGGGTINCPPESNPMMPTNTNTNINGSVFEFIQNISDVCPNTFWIDPPIAIGYSYSVAGGSFESVTLPSLQTVADTDGYTLHYNLNGWQSVPAAPSSQYVFPSPVSQYQIKGIDPALALNLHDPAAFAMGVKLTNLSGPQVKIMQIPMPLSTGVILDDPIHERLERARILRDGIRLREIADPVQGKPLKSELKKISPKPEKANTLSRR